MSGISSSGPTRTRNAAITAITAIESEGAQTFMRGNNVIPFPKG